MAGKAAVAKSEPKTSEVESQAAQGESAPASIFAKLLAVQMELKAPKSLYNSFGKYSYRSAEDILEAVKPVCSRHGLVPFITDDVVRVGEWNYVKATAAVFDVEDESKSIISTAFAREEETKKGMDAAQITGSASSYARKYAMSGLFAIDDNQDPDTRDNTVKTSTKKATDVVTTPPKQPTKTDILVECFALLKGQGYSKTDAQNLLTTLAIQNFEVKQLTDITKDQAIQLKGKVQATVSSEK